LKKEEATGPYLSLDPVKYAQTLTIATVNIAPARPETINLASNIAGKTDASQGNAYSANRAGQLLQLRILRAQR